MNKLVLNGRHRLFATSSLAGIAVLAAAVPNIAIAQTADPETIEEEVSRSQADSGEGAIVVTGSRIRRDEFSAAEPITVITSKEMTQAGFNSTADALQSNSVTAGASQINNYYGGFVTDGGVGANTLGLRGLGPNRTLVLLNGRRLAPGGTRGSVLAADLNVLPNAIVDRIEVLEAGASSVYGSDAVAGVVNIITDNNLRGLQFEASGTLPEVGAGSSYRLAGSFGFEADRLSVIGSLEYFKRNPISRNDVDFFNCPIGGFLSGEGTAFGSGDYIDPATGEPACFSLDNGGVTINTIGVSTRTSPDRLTGVLGSYNRLVPDASNTGPFTPGYTGVDYYTRDTYDPEQEEEYLVTPAEILTGYLSANYELDALGNAEAYVEVLATRRKSSYYLYRQLALDYPIYLNPDFTPTGRDNPLVPDQFKNSVIAFPNETTGDGYLGVRAFIGYGLTEGRQQVDYVRAGGGLRGDFFLPDWRYDFYAGKSWNDGTYELESFLIDRIAASLDVVENTDGSISCASAAINANCVAAPPLNADTVGGNLPQEYKDWILVNTVGQTRFRETTFAFNVDGPIFALPGGDAALAVGLEYRKQSINDTPDANSINGNLLGLTAATPTIGSDNVKEIYGELYLPLLADMPFAYELSINGSARYTDYDSYGSDTTYKIGGLWSPFRGVSFRGSYGTSYRAPALAEQFLGSTSGFISAGSDPCDSDGFPADPADYNTNQQIIAANCAAVGIDVATFTQNSGITVLRRGGAETGLSAETSTNWSVGAVVQPPLPSSVGSLSLSLDYFDIKVKNGVADLAGGTILNRCYSETNFDPNSGFCSFVDRDANDILTVTSSYVNLATDIVKGFEFNGRYARDIGSGQLTLNAKVTKYTEQSSKLFPEEYLTDANGAYFAPDWVGSFDALYAIGKVTLRYGLDWIDGDKDATYEYYAFDETTGMVDEALEQSYRDNYKFDVKDYFTHTISGAVAINEDLELTVGVRNLTDKMPPKVTAAVTTIGNAPLYSGYDYVGRTFFANITAGF
ncbi:TonB-dependent receptor domain-containing protein [Croceicoccus sp. Ery15]|uniref:TonB-dependent receptor domain-containing protein n=1 Tax=Croceicoccus sp. Ery15 TaxID=1703338 RepID=UPI001E5029F4|nr:TonB-dependent receptor [Croceicoccus sp. Ery15]